MENVVEDSSFLFESSKCCLGSKRRCVPYQYSCLLILCGFSSFDQDFFVVTVPIERPGISVL